MLVNLSSKTGISTAFALRSSCFLSRQANCDKYTTLTLASPSSSLSAPAIFTFTVSTALLHPRRDTNSSVSFVDHRRTEGGQFGFTRRQRRTAGPFDFRFNPQAYKDSRLRSPGCLLPGYIGQRTFTRTAVSTFTSTSTVAATANTTAGTAVTTARHSADTYSAPSSSSTSSSPPPSTTTTEPSHMEQQQQQHHHHHQQQLQYDYQDGPTTRVIKRKQPPTMTSPDKATKQLRAAHEPSQDSSTAPTALAMNGVINGSKGRKHGTADAESTSAGPDVNAGTLDGSVASGYESDTGMSPLIAPTSQGADTAEWQATIERVVKSVVSIHFCQTHSFDTEQALASEATGFVVDAERGYILTNRHVVGAGPFWGYCIFDNHEECDVYPVYRDPVHDFGILRFDPKAIKYMPLTSLELKPEMARVGVEIRVVGNDAGEKLSILSGVISRLDRNAPEYGDGYCDFNTNYIQAAASASGGSSGSPVVNLDGYAVALQAGGRSDGASTDYFLPLDRPFRALECIRKGEHIARGTIQTQWLLKPFDECRRLGLTPNWEAAMRASFPKETGMLVAELVLPEGPAHEKIEEGDLLIKVNDKLLTQFVRLDEILDASVSKKVNLLVQRGGKDMNFNIDVGDLHSITPDRFLNVAGASFHDLSYQLARINAVSLKGAGVYVCEAMGSFRFDGSELGWLIQSVDNKDTPNLDTFIEVMKNIPDRSRIVVTYKHLHDLHTLNTSIIFIDRHWYKKMRLAKRNDTTGLWDFTEIADALAPKPAEPRKANFIRMDNSKYPNAVDIVRSFVRISATMPIKLDGFPRTRKIGYGLVIDAKKGLVIVSRAIVPYDMCDISITIADSIIVDGKVRFMHPLQNYAIIQYDPSLVMAPVQSAKLSEKHIKQGDEIIFFGYNQNLRPVVGKTAVTDITTVAIPGGSMSPRYRAINLDAVTVDTNLASQCGSGVLISEDGTVQALWMTYLGERSSHSGKDTEYHLGLATPMLRTVLSQIQEGIQPELRILNVEMHSVQISQVRIMGVCEDWIERVEREDPERHQLFMVRKVDSGDVGGLQEGDIILTLNDTLISRVTDLDIMYNNSELDAVIVRKREEMRIKVATVPTADLETDRVVAFCGAVLHRPHHAVRQQISKVHSDVYVSGRMPGSPATMYALGITNFITHVNGTPTPDLDSFLATATSIPDNTYFRLRMMTCENIPWVITMKKNEHYFPTVELVKDGNDTDCGWRRIVHECDAAGLGEGEDGMVGLGGGADVGDGGDGGGGGGDGGDGDVVPVQS